MQQIDHIVDLSTYLEFVNNTTFVNKKTFLGCLTCIIMAGKHDIMTCALCHHTNILATSYSLPLRRVRVCKIAAERLFQRKLYLLSLGKVAEKKLVISVYQIAKKYIEK